MFKRRLLEKGSILVFSLIILSLMLTSALSIAAVSVGERRAASVTERSGRSFQVADSGVEIMLQKIYKGGFAGFPLSSLGTCTSGEISGTVGGGAYVISLYELSGAKLTSCSDTAWRNKVVKLKSEGTSGNTTRAVEAAVAAP